MSCRDVHATSVFAFIIALVSTGGLLVATLIPQWRVTRLVTFNRNARNVTVYDGLWAKCVRQEGSTGCYFYDTEWYARVDQLDLRVLQFALPFSIFFSTLALLLSMCGMCKTACCAATPEVDSKRRCLVNSAGCHLVAGMFLFLAGAIAMAPSVWFLFYTKEMNRKYDRIFSDDFAAYMAIGCSGGLVLAALLLFMWYCMCKRLPSPFWLPFPAMSQSYSTQPLTSNGYPSPVYAPAQTYVPQAYPPSVLDAQAYAQSQYPESQYPQSQYPQSQYGQSQYGQSQYAQSQYPQSQYGQSQYAASAAPQGSAPDGYGSEAGTSQAYGAHSYAPSQGYGSGYGGPRYSTRSRLSAIEIDIPVVTHEL
ncbi:claudin-12 [Anguilla anguilla]|uniref:claudin-12 n=1 Tax=Anguilla anguilla TaxID=7936 RepID=UPI0015B1A78D|nr:claudin-12 [Anguilla anguilla]